MMMMMLLTRSTGVMQQQQKFLLVVVASRPNTTTVKKNTVFNSLTTLRSVSTCHSHRRIRPRPDVASRNSTITLKRFSTGNTFDKSSATSVDPIVVSWSSPENSTSTIVKSLSELRNRTKDWLKIPIGSWTAQDTSKGRFLFHEWSSTHDNDDYHHAVKERAVQQTEILRRWMKEYESKKNMTGNMNWMKNKKSNVGRKDNDYGGNGNDEIFSSSSKSSSREMLEMLHRCLDSWRKVKVRNTSRPNQQRQEEILELIEWMGRISEQTNNRHIKPNHKTYSMFINILGEQFPSSKSVIGIILSLFDRCQQKDLQFYSICLHALAKCSLYHEKAPIVAERIFQRLLSSKTLQPDTICFISLLHAWSNSSSSTTIHQDSAESSFASAVRAQAILEQMIQNHLDLVHTVCFNICIDGWANQGRLDKAEDILNRMETLYQQQHCVDKDRLRPSISSFNSAIKACALANHKNCHDSVNAARQAELILHRMESSGITPNIESFTWVMQAYIKTTEPGEKVQALLDQLEDRFAKGDIIHPPSSVCYLTAIQAWGRTTMTPSISLVKDRHIDKITPPERAEMLVQRMIEISSDDTGRRDLEPCVIIYTALIDAWGNSLRPEASGNALRIFTNMKQGKLGRKAFPNTVTLNVLLKTFCRHGRIEDAWDLLKQTKQHVAPDLKSYHTILKAYTHSDLTSAAENAQELVREMETEYDDRKNEDLKPTEYTYMQLLVSWGNSKRHDAAVHAEEIFWNMMNQDGTSVKPTKHHLNCVLRAFSRSAEGGAAERAESFLERVQKLMGKSSELIEPDAISHLHMIQVWIRSGRMIGRRKAKSHLDRVRALCTENESDVLDAAITAFSRHFA